MSLILRGIEMRRTDRSYLKERFKLLQNCGGYQELEACYDCLGEKVQNIISRLSFYYISAHHKLGLESKAYEMLEEGGRHRLHVVIIPSEYNPGEQTDYTAHKIVWVIFRRFHEMYGKSGWGC